MILYFSGMMYKYYFRLRFIPIIHNKEGKYIHNKIFNNIPHFIKTRLCVNCLQDNFRMYNDKVFILIIEVINPIPNYDPSEFLFKKKYIYK